ncbi:MAG: hypothetical protein AAF557_05390 [Pseudomonadota bacterium]
MSLEESVKQVLRKIAHHNRDVFGCIATYDKATYSTLPEIYDLIDVDAVIEYANNMFVITEALETGDEQFDEVFLEFQGHSFVVRRMRIGLLILATKPIKRGAFRKMQLGLNLFLKPLERALLIASGEDHDRLPAETKLGSRSLRRVFENLV